jgi:hypothetical protein
LDTGFGHSSDRAALIMKRGFDLISRLAALRMLFSFVVRHARRGRKRSASQGCLMRRSAPHKINAPKECVAFLFLGLLSATFVALFLAAIAKFDLHMSSEEVRVDALCAACFVFGAVVGLELHKRS